MYSNKVTQIMWAGNDVMLRETHRNRVDTIKNIINNEKKYVIYLEFHLVVVCSAYW